MKEVYIVSAARTAQGSFGGALSGVSATKLGSTAIAGALKKAGIDGKEVGEVFMGNVVSANLGQAPARQAALGAGIDIQTPCTTVNKVCASGMKSIMLAAQSIMLGFNDVVVAGGMESMSNIPFYLDKARFKGYGYGDGKFIDGLSKDGLSDAYDNCAMGICGDMTAEEAKISREEQDEYAILSYKRAAAAWEAGNFDDEIVPVEIPQRRGDAVIVKHDEEYKKVKFEKIPTLRPIFTKEGTVTAANASTINDGASALVLMSGEKVKELGLKPIAKIRGFADAAHEPLRFATAPVKAAPLALKRAGLTKDDIDFFEVNEAFAVVPLAFNKALDIPVEKVNVWGGGVSIGHPLGSSGSRIVTTLTSVLAKNNAKYGLATLCNGGGGASAIVIERV